MQMPDFVNLKELSLGVIYSLSPTLLNVSDLRARSIPVMELAK